MRAFVVIAALAVVACSPSGGSPPPRRAGDAPPSLAKTPWMTTEDRGHPLVGRIWDARARRFVGADDVFADVSRADFVVLGEKHDNADHHALQALTLRAMIARKRSPAVAFEMLDEDQQAAVDAYVASPGATAAGFGPLVAWDARGWRSYAWYAPIVDAALAAKLPIVAANLTRKEIRAIMHGGEAVPSARAKELGLDVPLPPAQAAEVVEEMRASHCGQLPEEMLLPMAVAQHARDVALGGHMLRAAKGRPVVLIAGNGHGRTDRGVPAVLSGRLPTGTKVVSVAFVEVTAGVSAPDSAPYDYVWYTPRATDEDPCAKMAVSRGERM